MMMKSCSSSSRKHSPSAPRTGFCQPASRDPCSAKARAEKREARWWHGVVGRLSCTKLHYKLFQPSQHRLMLLALRDANSRPASSARARARPPISSFSAILLARLETPPLELPSTGHKLYYSSAHSTLFQPFSLEVILFCSVDAFAFVSRPPLRKPRLATSSSHPLQR
jgi:hypothetical protein